MRRKRRTVARQRTSDALVVVTELVECEDSRQARKRVLKGLLCQTVDQLGKLLAFRAKS